MLKDTSIYPIHASCTHSSRCTGISFISGRYIGIQSWNVTNDMFFKIIFICLKFAAEPCPVLVSWYFIPKKKQWFWGFLLICKMTCIVKIWYQTEQKNQGHQNKVGWGCSCLPNNFVKKKCGGEGGNCTKFVRYTCSIRSCDYSDLCIQRLLEKVHYKIYKLMEIHVCVHRSWN